jgi:hypothetical protein
LRQLTAIHGILTGGLLPDWGSEVINFLAEFRPFNSNTQRTISRN